MMLRTYYTVIMRRLKKVLAHGVPPPPLPNQPTTQRLHTPFPSPSFCRRQLPHLFGHSPIGPPSTLPLSSPTSASPGQNLHRWFHHRLRHLAGQLVPGGQPPGGDHDALAHRRHHVSVVSMIYLNTPRGRFPRPRTLTTNPLHPSTERVAPDAPMPRSCFLPPVCTLRCNTGAHSLAPTGVAPSTIDRPCTAGCVRRFWEGPDLRLFQLRASDV